jgi:alpha/beta superfamily hydrolase
MKSADHTVFVAGTAGAIEVAVDLPNAEDFPVITGLAVFAHPHPLFGGANTNKVVQTLARAAVSLGYVAVRPNFRGVGKTEGEHDEGRGEADDLLAVVLDLRTRYPQGQLVLGGFSFGSFVQSHVAARLRERNMPPSHLVMVGTAASRWTVAAVPPSSTLVIHGEMDDTVPLSAVLDWARPQELPVVVVPGADHFFHRKLPIIKRLVTSHLMLEPSYD